MPRTHSLRRFRWPGWAVMCLAAGMIAGCGGDDDNPTNPDGGGTGTNDQFDQSTAVTQAEATATQAVGLVESMTTIAAGFTKTAEKNYAWNPETQRWEYHYTYSGEGYVYDWNYTVQYLGEGGVPQQTPQGAATVSHAMNGTGSYNVVSQGSVLVYDYTYDYATTISGLGTNTLVMTGGGGQDIDYSYTSPQGNYAANYSVAWEILPPGIAVSGQGGCPTGTIRYDFAPYYSLVEFSGSNVATSTLYAAGGAPVAGGGTTRPLSCGTR